MAKGNVPPDEPTVGVYDVVLRGSWNRYATGTWDVAEFGLQIEDHVARNVQTYGHVAKLDIKLNNSRGSSYGNGGDFVLEVAVEARDEAQAIGTAEHILRHSIQVIEMCEKPTIEIDR